MYPLTPDIDRANIGNAKIEGLTEDLKLSGQQYNTCQSIFFVTYILFEIPCNMVLQKYFKNRPSWWIALLTVLWGLCMTLHGVVNNYGGMIAVRLALGIPESGFFPGAVAIVSGWYPRHMLNSRIAIFYTASALAGAFSGLLAFAIAKLGGVGGIAPWRWIFLLEGGATVALGLVVPFLLPDTPANSSWLTEEEKRYFAITTAAQDNSTSGAHESTEHVSKLKILWSVLTDWQLWVQGVVYWSNTVCSYSMKFTLPTIIKTMGFSSSNAQLLTIPPYVVGSVTACLAGIYSDRFRRRMPFIVCSQIAIIAAFIIILPIRNDIKKYMGPAYFALCVVCGGTYPIGPGCNSWTANNLAGPAKRAMGVALLISWANVGGIVGGMIYMDKEKPGFTSGYVGSLAFAVGGVVAALFLEFMYMRINKKRDAIPRAEIEAKYTPLQLAEMGDRSPLYRYML